MKKHLTPCKLKISATVGAMSSSDRDTDEASPKKKIKWCTQHFYGRMVERSRSQRLGTEGHWGGKFNCKMPHHRQKRNQVHVTGI